MKELPDDGQERSPDGEAEQGAAPLPLVSLRCLRAVRGLLAAGKAGQALCIGGDPALRAAVCALEGRWEESPYPVAGSYQEAAFDRVVVLEGMRESGMAADDILAYHRLLRPGGKLILLARRAVPGSPLRLLRIIAGLDRSVRGHTATGLFDLLKDGFDVEESRAFSRGFGEAADLLYRLQPASAARPGAGGRFLRAASFQLADTLDLLLFFTRGHRLALLARQRPWKPRRAPVLRDGRSLAEATLAAKIGSANPF